MRVSREILHSEISGQGKTIVLLHGYLSSSHYFKAIRPYLERDFTVVAIDLLGFGKSPKPRIDYTYEQHIDAVRQTIELLNIQKPFTLLGHSMGALIALRYAVDYPEEIDDLLLFNPPLFTDNDQMLETHKATGRHYRAMLHSPARHLYWPSLKLVPRNSTKYRGPINFTDSVRMSSRAREGSYRHIIGGAQAFNDLKKTWMPVLLVNGKYDRAVYIQNLARHKFPSNVTVQTIETGHHPLVKNVGLAEEVIRSHLIQ
ncbi:MAG: alpha/beta hydrolase [Candidatus Saccharibacteria bacterium]|nr:alpha/beta hydrolase [Candidatus Saccharibacteria bacterium]